MPDRFDAYSPGDRLRGVLAASIVITLLGLMAVVAALAGSPASDGYYWNNIVAGLLVAALGAWQAWAAWSDDATPSLAAAGAVIVVALWLAASPFLYVVDVDLTSANVIIGLTAALLGAFNAWAVRAGGAARARPLQRSGF